MLPKDRTKRDAKLPMTTEPEQSAEHEPLRPALAAGLAKALEYVEKAREELKAVGEQPPSYGVQPYDLRRRLGIVGDDIKKAIKTVHGEKPSNRPHFSFT
jgi:hypothetical protein